MKRSLRKKDLKAARKARQRDPDVKRGFRKMVIDGVVWSWRNYGTRVEIKVPGTLSMKLFVPVWQLRGCESEAAWEAIHAECCCSCGSLGCDYDQCFCHTITPGLVRKYIDEMRNATH